MQNCLLHCVQCKPTLSAMPALEVAAAQPGTLYQRGEALRLVTRSCVTAKQRPSRESTTCASWTTGAWPHMTIIILLKLISHTSSTENSASRKPTCRANHIEGGCH